jgi:hypothetical protein
MTDLTQFPSDTRLAALLLAASGLETGGIRGVDAEELSIFRCFTIDEAGILGKQNSTQERKK